MTHHRSKRNLPAYSVAMEQGSTGDGPRPYCEGREAEYADYRTVPDRETADEMCLPCPLYAVCRKNAKHMKPAWGVMGGIAWVDGRHAHLRKESADKPLRNSPLNA